MTQYDFVIGDRVSFTERVHPKIKHGFRQDLNTGKTIATPEIPQQIVPQRGEGTVIRTLREMKVGGRKVKTLKVKTLKVHAGSPLGNIVIVADDAVLTAHPLTLDLGDEAGGGPAGGPSMYGTDSKGHA